MLGIPSDDAADQILGSADPVGLEDLGDRLEHLDRLGQLSLRELDQHHGADRIAERARIDLGAVPRDHPGGLELGQPGLDGAAGDAELTRDLEQAHARIAAQGRDQARVERVDGHVLPPCG